MTIEEFFARTWDMLIGRVHGPMTFRLICQPLVAIIIAVRHALRDSREGRSLYFSWSLFANAARRHDLLVELWKEVGKVFVVAVVLDVIYELIVYRWVYPGQAVIVATVLAIIPYLLIRGPVRRIAERFVRANKKPSDKPT